MLGNGRIDLHRSLTKWRWYKNGNTMRLFIHLLLTVSWKDDDFEQITVRRGQRVASRRSLAEETGMTEREIRTALNHLISTGEVTSESYTKYTVITIENYDRYQAPTSKTTSKRPASDQQATSKRPHDNQYNQYNQANQDNNILFSSDLSSARGRASTEEERAGDVCTDEMTVDEYRDYLLATMPESAISSGLVESLVQAHAKKRT